MEPSEGRETFYNKCEISVVKELQNMELEYKDLKVKRKQN